MQNSLRQSNNSLSPTLPVKDQYGRFDIGGLIGPGDIKNAMAADPQVQMGGNMLLDVTPVVESVRSVDRLPEQWQAYQNAESPIQQVLRAAEMALEGGALVADVIPHVKALGIGGAALIGLMARRTDEIEGIARFGLAKRQQGLIGYHGSPHKFDRFRHSQMGTGEGAQAYGWGTYIAENPDVAKSYGNDLAYGIELPGAHPAANRQIARDFAGSDFNDAADIPDEWYQEIANDFREAGMDDVARSIETADKAAARAVTPNHYTVDLPDSKIAQMLDWDAPLYEQKAVVKQLGHDNQVSRYMEIDDQLSELMKSGGLDSPAWENLTNEAQVIRRELGYSPLESGQDFYRRMVSGGSPLEDMGDMLGKTDAQQMASEKLNQLGIPGIKYFDGNSRGAGQGTRNFVVFDENDLTILSRNGEAVNHQGIFAPEGIEAAKASGELEYMTPKEYLNLAGGLPDGPDGGKLRNLWSSTARGEKINNIPMLKIDGDNVVSHEGRHRAFVAMEAGEDKIPVRVSRNGESVLPMDEASRMARAKEMGALEGDYYHGSNKNYKKTKNNIGEESFWSTDDPAVASDFATYRRTWEGANVKPVKPMGKYLEIDGKGQNIRNAEKSAERQVGVGNINYGETIEDYARREGYDGIRFLNVTDEIPGSPAYTGQSTLVQTFDPKNIRSKHATFDPAKRNSPKLLDSKLLPIPSAGLMGYGALREEDR